MLNISEADESEAAEDEAQWYAKAHKKACEHPEAHDEGGWKAHDEGEHDELKPKVTTIDEGLDHLFDCAFGQPRIIAVQQIDAEAEAAAKAIDAIMAAAEAEAAARARDRSREPRG